MFNASADLLEYLRLREYAQYIRDAIHKAINVEKMHTADLGGDKTTSEVVEFIIKEVTAQTNVKPYQPMA